MKRTLILLLSILVVLTQARNSFALDTDELDNSNCIRVGIGELTDEMIQQSMSVDLYVLSEDGSEIKLSIPESIATEMNVDIVEDILNDVYKDTYGDAIALWIYKYQKCSNPPPEMLETKQARGILGLIKGYYIKTEPPEVIGNEYRHSRQMIENVARGSWGTLDKRYEIDINLEIEGDFYNKDIRTGFSPMITFYSNTSFSGIKPEIILPGNSRSFYLQTYKQDYVREQSMIDSDTGEILDTRNVRIMAGSCSIEYAVDVKI